MAKKEYTFVKGARPSIVWNPATKTPLAEFTDPETGRVSGVFKTSDEDVAKKLRELGYKEESDFPQGAPQGGWEEIPEPPTHITPGGPKPSIKEDIKIEETPEEVVPEEIEVEEPEGTVTEESLSETTNDISEEVETVVKAPAKKAAAKKLAAKKAPAKLSR